MHHLLKQKISTKSLRVAVIGLGYAGLPVAVRFAEAGFNVIGIDTDQQRVDQVNRGKSYIPDVSDSALQNLLAMSRLHFTSDYRALDDIDAISICVPTPLGKSRDPDLSYIVSVIQQVQAHLHAGQLVVLESTTYPGTIEEIVLPILESRGLKVGSDFFLAYSPERIDPGNPRFDIRNTPKIVGGVTSLCSELAQAFYGAAIEQIVPTSSVRAAEMIKLLENTYRAVNIGLVNEIAIMCEKLRIDVWEVIDAAATKPFGFMPFFPGPGLGGHCIPVDPHYLSWKLKTLDYTARFIELASEINASMPNYVVNKISDALNEQRRSCNGATILVLGVTYKRNVGDIRASPALDIMQSLLARKALVLYNDQYVPSLMLQNQTLYSQPVSADLLKTADCVVVVTDHSYYDVPLIIHAARCIVDTRNMTRGYSEEKIYRL